MSKRLMELWLKLGLSVLRLHRFWLNLRLFWLSFQVWFWTKGLEIFDVNDEETLLRKEMQGLRRMAAMEPPPYILAERPKWLEEALKTGADTAELAIPEEKYDLDLKGDLKDE